MYDLWWLIGLLIIMAVMSIFDIKNKILPLPGMVLMFAYALIYRIISEDWTWYLLALSILPGAVLAAISFLTEGKIGMGDAIILAILGFGMGIERCMFSFFAGLILNAFAAVVLLILHKADRKTEIPFMPFLTIGIGAMAYVIR